MQLPCLGDQDLTLVRLSSHSLNFAIEITNCYWHFIVDGTTPKMSNELEVTLPLATNHIRLPPMDVRTDDEDLYKEYIEVREGSGYSPQMDQGMRLQMGF